MRNFIVNRPGTQYNTETFMVEQIIEHIAVSADDIDFAEGTVYFVTNDKITRVFAVVPNLDVEEVQ
jgi:predicted ester cyclase